MKTFSRKSLQTAPPMLSTPSACVSSVGHVCVLVQMLQTGSRALKNGCARCQGPANLLNGVVFFFKKIFLCLPSFCQKHHYHHLVFGCKSICLVERDAVLLTQCCVSTRPTDPKRVKKGHSLLAFHQP